MRAFDASPHGLTTCCAKGGRRGLGAAAGGSTLDSLIFACASASRMSDSSCLGVAEIVFLLVLILRICSNATSKPRAHRLCAYSRVGLEGPESDAQVCVCERTVCARARVHMWCVCVRARTRVCERAGHH